TQLKSNSLSVLHPLLSFTDIPIDNLPIHPTTQSTHSNQLYQLWQNICKSLYGKRRHTNLAARVAPEEKDLCYRSRDQGKGGYKASKAWLTDLSGLTELVVWNSEKKDP
ncbi:39741_t:CDS:2, partial [Gigaspora margarita]